MLMCRWYKELQSDLILFFFSQPRFAVCFLALIKFCQFPSMAIFDISVGEFFNTTKRLGACLGFRDQNESLSVR